jgi:hypothetical protein
MLHVVEKRTLEKGSNTFLTDIHLIVFGECRKLQLARLVTHVSANCMSEVLVLQLMPMTVSGVLART